MQAVIAGLPEIHRAKRKGILTSTRNPNKEVSRIRFPSIVGIPGQSLFITSWQKSLVPGMTLRFILCFFLFFKVSLRDCKKPTEQREGKF